MMPRGVNEHHHEENTGREADRLHHDAARAGELDLIPHLDHLGDRPEKHPFKCRVDRCGHGGGGRLEDRDYRRDETADPRDGDDAKGNFTACKLVPCPRRRDGQNAKEHERFPGRPLHGHRRAARGPVDLLVTSEHVV